MLEVVKTNIQRSILAGVLLAATLFIGVSPVSAVTQYPYGDDTSYGECSYGFGCGSQPTEVTTPTGLQVSINLEDGQTIPKSGYTVIVTPLNGQGRTFDHVEFWLDGVLVHTAYPASDGTAKWEWDPAKNPGTSLTVVIIDTDGSRITEQFNIKIGDGSSTGTGNETPGTGSSPDQNTPAAFVGRVIEQIGTTFNAFLETAQDVIRTIPAPIILAFPYFLLLLILLNIILLVSQAHREFQEYQILRAIIARGRAVNEAKKTLAQLVSHYLRTPLTLLMGGVDMLKQDTTVQSAVNEFDAISNHLHLKIEALINQAVTDAGSNNEMVTSNSLSKASVWKQRGLFLPLFITPLVLIPYNFVAATAGSFTSTQINIAAQLILFAILITTMYIVLRQRQLRQRDAVELKEVINAEAAVNQSRDTLIVSAADALDEDLKEIDSLLGKVDNPEAVNFIKTGQARFRDMLSKLRVAARLKGLRSETPVTDVAFSELFAKAVSAEQSKAMDKHVSIVSEGQGNIRTQSPELVTFVLQSLIDNAIAYSNENSQVEVGITRAGSETVVSVTDHGVGISPEKVSLLFQPFTKTEGAEVFTHEGMGFSLYLDKLITEYVGASIDVSSDPGKKTTFSLRFANQSAQ